jgi:predicted phosphoribosyltransferase
VLGSLLRDLAGRRDLTVLGLPRGGVPVASEIARTLGAPLDVFVVRKRGVPGHRELAMGAIASGGIRVLSHDLIAELGIPHAAVEAVAREEQQELARRERHYRDRREPLTLRDRTVVLVDDGLATGSTMHAAVAAVRARDPQRVIVAVPVGSRSACAQLRQRADEVVCAWTPEEFRAVGEWYEDVSETSDDEVRALLGIARGPSLPAGGRA